MGPPKSVVASLTLKSEHADRGAGVEAAEELQADMTSPNPKVKRISEMDRQVRTQSALQII